MPTKYNCKMEVASVAAGFIGKVHVGRRERRLSPSTHGGNGSRCNWSCPAPSWLWDPGCCWGPGSRCCSFSRATGILRDKLPTGDETLQCLQCMEQMLEPSSGQSLHCLHILLLLQSGGRCFPRLPLCSTMRVTQLGCSICCKSLILSVLISFWCKTP